MKKRMNRFIYVLAALVLFATSCDWEPIMWDSSKAYVAFTAPTTAIPEEGNAVGVVVLLTALEGDAVTVEFEFDTVGISPEKAAFEGEHFELVNDSKTLSFPNGWGYDTIWIQPYDNDIFTGDKNFNITLTSNTADLPFGASVSNAVTIKDDEHPLGIWIGTYDVAAASYLNPGNWDEQWAVTTGPDPSDVGTLLITISQGGRAGNTFPAAMDLEEMTITIVSGTDVGNIYGYGSTTIWYGDAAGADKSMPIIGEIKEDGTILIDKVAMLLPAYGDYHWDSFNTTWTKTAKKSAVLVKIDDSKASRIN